MSLGPRQSESAPFLVCKYACVLIARLLARHGGRLNIPASQLHLLKELKIREGRHLPDEDLIFHQRLALILYTDLR